MTIGKLLYIAALPLVISPLSVWAASDAEVDELIATTHLLTRRAEDQQRAITALQNRVSELENQVRSVSLGDIRGRGAPADNPSLAAAIAQVNNGVTVQSSTVVVSDAQSGTTVKPGTAQAQAITSTQGIPLFDRKFSFEQGLTYTHYDKRSLVLSGFLALDSILLGKINLQQIKTDQLQYDLTGRWNMSDRLSLDVNLPLVYRTSNYFSPGAGNSAGTISDGSNHTAAMGDASAGVYYQLGKESSESPDWIASIRVKAPTGRDPFGIKLITDKENTNLLIPSRQPTGNGVWSTSLGLSALKTYDPVVLFANIGYNYNFKRSFEDLSSAQNTVAPGQVQLGNSWSLGAGFALALNDKTSVSFSYSQSVQVASKLRAEGGSWVRQVGSESNSATFNTGLTRQFTKNLTMVGTLSVGLTPDSPDFSVGIKFPYTF
ncbi:MAG: transporter [Burkholderiaceae bacterium]